MQAATGQALTLPTPDADSAAHSRLVARHIAECIAAGGGSMSFAEFMQAALYAPGLGYYVSGTRKFGPGGDFVTAPEISPLFGRVVARQCKAVLEQSGFGDILELGAGSGALAATVLGKLDELGALPDRYAILEISPDLSARQQEYLAARVPALVDRVTWLSALPDRFDGVVIVNEVADALPVERFQRSGQRILQCRVVQEGDGFAWQLAPASGALERAVTGIESRLRTMLPDGYTSEVCLALAPWVSDLVRSVNEGVILLFDYGVSAREYYAPDRQSGWLRCHFRHHAHDDPLIYPGIQDLTSWLDFSALAEAAAGAGADVAGYVTQAHFLVNGGLADELAGFEDLPPAEQMEWSRQTKLLTLPDEMGENFKCIGIVCGDAMPPPALLADDRTHRL